MMRKFVDTLCAMVVSACVAATITFAQNNPPFPPTPPVVATPNVTAPLNTVSGDCTSFGATTGNTVALIDDGSPCATLGGVNLYTGALPSITANGQAGFAASAVNGASIQGQGSVNDFMLNNSSGGSVCNVLTGSAVLTCSRISLTNTAAAAIQHSVTAAAQVVDLLRNTSPNAAASYQLQIGNNTSITEVTFTLNSSANATGNGPNSFTIAAAGGLYTAGEIFTAAAPTVAAGQIGFGGTTAALTNCGSTVLTTATACLVINVNGTNRFIPYF